MLKQFIVQLMIPLVQYNVLKFNDSNLIDVDMTTYLKFFHISLELSYISIKANASVMEWEK